MNRTIAASLAAVAWIGLLAPVGQAAGLFHADCDSGCCDTACDGSSCGEPCCDASDACDACVGCGKCDSLCSCLGDMKLLGCLKPSDHCFDDFISPMINFAFFEDPRTLTEIRPIYVYHQTPNRVGTLGVPGGDVHLWLSEIRLALTERLSLITTKNGYFVEDIDEGPLDDLLDDGWAAVNVGLKYNVLRDVRRGRLGSIGLTYEMPVGSRHTLQDIGDGEFHIFGTGGVRLRDGNAHYLTSFGVRIPVDEEVQTTSLHWSNHFDVRLTERVYFVSEAAWWHWVSSADTGLPLGVAGQDLFNLSSTNVAGNDLITKNFGLKYKPNRHIETGIAYEFPITGREDVIKDRIQIDLIFRR